MFNKLIVLYVPLIIILVIALALTNANREEKAWVKKIPQAEQKLYTLEMSAVLNEVELNRTKAEDFYRQREAYCGSYKEESAVQKCLKRTKPWWDEKYQE